MSSPDPLVAALAARCETAGFDLVRAFNVAWYNDAVAAEYRLPDLGRPHALGILIGNTRALWPRFVAALREEPALLADPDPIERYTVARLRAALEPLQPRWEARWAHAPPPERVAIQRLGQISGLAHLGPCGLNVHPVYGPWIALRAAVVVDVDGPGEPAPDPPRPCPDCEHACLPRFAAAAATLRAGAAVADSWPLWLAMRDACPVGRHHRYSEAQIAYHYRKDRGVLEKAAGER